MTEKKINITSTALEKGINIAKDFLDKLITPALEETGILLRDQVTFWKFKNQIRILNKAKEYCEKNNISTKVISLKVLCPLLDNAALEEDEVLQDKWAILLSNLVDSDQNIENHVFPYILGQISLNEFMCLEKSMQNQISREEVLEKNLQEARDYRSLNEGDIKMKIRKLEEGLEMHKNSKGYVDTIFVPEARDMAQEKFSLELELESIIRAENIILTKINEPHFIKTSDLREFEISNLIRLGLIEITQYNYANPYTIDISSDFRSDYYSIELDIEIQSDFHHIVTELGELFVQACTEKGNKPNTPAIDA